MKISTKKLTMAAMFAALSIVLTRFFSIMITQDMRIGFGTLPIMLSGIFLGPAVGSLTGIVADLIGIMINPMGSTIHLGFTLSSMLSGLIPGIIFHYIFKRDEKKIIPAIILSTVVVYGGVHLILNSLWLSDLYGKGIMELFEIRLLKISVEAVFVGILQIVIYKLVPKSVTLKI